MTNFSFTKIDVPAPVTPYVYISADGVDAAGDAVGNYGNVDGEDDGTFHGFTAEGGTGTTFDPPGSSNTDIAGITSSGEIFGDYVDFANKQHGFVVNNGVVTTIDVFLANSTTVFGVTGSGLIYGSYADFANEVHGFLDNNGNIAQIDVPGATSTSIFGANAFGTIVGTYFDAKSTLHGFVDSNGTFTSFDPQGSIFTSVVGISDGGEIAGNYQDISNNTYGFVDNNGVISKINIPGATNVGVQAINAAGEIVGYYVDNRSNVHGFIDNGGIITTIDVPGATQTDVLSVNAAGEISGYYSDSNNIQHAFVGTPPPVTVIESFGSTSLVQVGNNYFLDGKSTGTGPEVMFGGTPVVAGQIGGWTPIGAEATATGYEVALKLTGSNQYTVWNTDGNGNVTYDAIGVVSGTSTALESLEPSFHQDLNGDGVIGIPATVIESFGSTSLVEVGNNFFMHANGTATGPELMYGGAAVVAGQIGGWTPIGAEATATGYEVALKLAGSNQYTVWNTDSSGNVIYDAIGVVSGTSTTLESLEPGFHQDLNGDGMIGIPAIESFGSTSLVEVGNNFFMYANGTTTGPELMYGGGAVVAGQIGGWTPIGAEATATGYEVALKLAGTSQYTVWNTDSSGNVTYDAIGVVSGNSTTLESLEPTFHQDLNGDGAIGIPPIESAGTTSLVLAGNAYFLDSNSTGTGPELKYDGAPLLAGQWGSWTPIGAEATATGYEIAWKLTGSDLYSVWNTDGNGNITTDAVGAVAGNSVALESVESSFHQDLNGDGVIGQAVEAAGTLEVNGADAGSVKFVGPTGTLILDHSTQFSGQVLGFTGNGSLLSSDQLDLRDIGFGPGTTVGYSGTGAGGVPTVSDAQNHTAHITLAGDYTSSVFTLSSDGSGGTTVIDPVVTQDAAGGTLSFSDPDPTDTYSVSVSPQNGGAGYLGSFVADAVNAANGQDTVGWHFNFASSPVSQTVIQSYDISVADHHADSTTSTTSQSVTVTIAGSGNDTFVFHPGVGGETIVNAGSSGTIELDGFSSVTSNNQLAALLHDAQTGQPQSLFQSVNGGHDTLINLGNHDSVTLMGVHLADLHASDFIIH